VVCLLRRYPKKAAVIALLGGFVVAYELTHALVCEVVALHCAPSTEGAVIVQLLP